MYYLLQIHKLCQIKRRYFHTVIIKRVHSMVKWSYIVEIIAKEFYKVSYYTTISKFLLNYNLDVTKFYFKIFQRFNLLNFSGISKRLPREDLRLPPYYHSVRQRH